MAEVASAVVALIPSFKGGQSAIARELNGPADKAGRQAGESAGKGFGARFAKVAGGLLAPLLAGIGVGAVTSFFSGAITEASGLNESMNALKVTYGENADAVAELGTQAATSLGLSNLEFNNLAVRFSSFANTIAGSGGDVTGTLDDLTTRASDFASVMNLDVNEAAQLFQSGLAGESEPLRQYGIDLSAASVNAYAYANGIAEAGETLTEQQRVQAAYGAIMEQTAATQGDFANTSDQLANQQRILQARLADSRAELGSALLPALTAVTTFLANSVGPAFDGLSGAVRSGVAGLQVFGAWFQQNQQVIVNVATVIAALMLPVLIRLGVAATISAAQQVAAWTVSGAGAVKTAALYVLASYQMVAGWVRAGAAAVASAARQVAAWVLLGAQSLIQAARVAAAWLIAMGPIGLVIALVVGLVALIIANWDKIREVTLKVWSAITRWLSEKWNAIKTTATTVWNAIVTFISGVPERIRAGLDALGTSLRNTVSGWFENVKTAATDKFDELVTWVKEIPNRIVSALGNMGDLLYNAGSQILSGFLSGLKSGWDEVTGWVGGIGTWIADNKGPKAYDLALLRPAGRWIMTGLQDGLEDERANLGRTLQGVSDVIAGQQFAASSSGLGSPAAAAATGLAGREGPLVQIDNLNGGEPGAVGREVRWALMGV